MGRWQGMLRRRQAESSGPLPPVTSGVIVTSYAPGPLEAGTQYSWVVTASDGISTTVGQMWHLTTVAEHLVYLSLMLRRE
jgi:hypothetical protein